MKDFINKTIEQIEEQIVNAEKGAARTHKAMKAKSLNALKEFAKNIEEMGEKVSEKVIAMMLENYAQIEVRHLVDRGALKEYVKIEVEIEEAVEAVEAEEVEEASRERGRPSLISDDEVRAMIEHCEKVEGGVSVRSLRRRLGGGSPNRLAALLREHKGDI